MALEWLDSPDKAFEEVQVSQEYLRHFLADYRDVLTRYHTSGYRTDGAKDDSHTRQDVDDPENGTFETVALMLPHLVFGNPRVRVRTKRMGASRDVAKAVQFGINQWVKDTKMRQLNEALATDHLIKYSVSIVTRKPEEGIGYYHSPKNFPDARRVSPEDFIFDTQVRQREHWRFMGHRSWIDQSTVLERAKDPANLWDPEVVENMLSGTRSQRPGFRNAPDYKQHNAIDRNEIEYFEVYVPEIQLDAFPAAWKKKKGEKPTREAGYNGTIFTIPARMSPDGTKKQNEYPREPFPFWGPPSGPYTVTGEYIVPEESVPLSTTGATKRQGMHRNDHLRAMNEEMDSYKRVTAVAGLSESSAEDGVDAVDPDVAEFVTDSMNRHVWHLENVDDLKDRIYTFEFGGVTQQHLVFDERNKDNYDRARGLSDALRGFAESGKTATADQIAAQSSASRTGHRVGKFRDGVQEILTKVAWYLVMDDEVKFELNDEADGKFFDEIGNPIARPQFVGGISPDQSEDFTFDDLDLEIEPFSMQKSDAGLQQMQAVIVDNTIEYVSTRAPQAPFVKWRKYVEQKGRLLDIPDLAEAFDWDKLDQFTQLILSGQLPVVDSTASPASVSSPMLSRNTAGGQSPSRKAPEGAGLPTVGSSPQPGKVA